MQQWTYKVVCSQVSGIQLLYYYRDEDLAKSFARLLVGKETTVRVSVFKKHGKVPVFSFAKNDCQIVRLPAGRQAGRKSGAYGFI